MSYFWVILFLLTFVAIALVLKPLIFPNKAILQTEQITTQPAYKLAIFCVLGIPLIASCLYFKFGNSKGIAQWLELRKKNGSIKQQIAKFGSRQNIILALQKKLTLLPENEQSANGWNILGKLYFNENKINEAISSFQHAMKLKPNDSEYMLQFVSAKFYKYHLLDETDKKIIQALLRLIPNNVNAINLLALDAYQRNNFAQAIQYWETLLPLFQPESEDTKNLLVMIEQAQKQLPVAKPGHTTAAKSIVVTINCSPEIERLRKKNEVLFVYALEEKGLKIPLAVVKMAGAQLPKKVILDSTQNMISGKSLNDATNIYIEARLSKSGYAMPSQGDMIGASNVFTLKKKQSVAITINQILK